MANQGAFGILNSRISDTNTNLGTRIDEINASLS
jgi:hypothetical protein